MTTVDNEVGLEKQQNCACTIFSSFQNVCMIDGPHFAVQHRYLITRFW